MGKKIKFTDPKNGEIITVDKDNCLITTYEEMIR